MCLLDKLLIYIQFQRKKKNLIKKISTKDNLSKEIALGWQRKKTLCSMCRVDLFSLLESLKMYGPFLDFFRSKMNNLWIGTKILGQILIFPILWVRISTHVIASFGYLYMNLCNLKLRIQWFLPQQISHRGLHGSTGHTTLNCIWIVLTGWTDASISITLCYSWQWDEEFGFSF